MDKRKMIRSGILLSALLVFGGSLQAQERLTVDSLVNSLQNKKATPHKELSVDEIQEKIQNRIIVEKAISGKNISLEERNQITQSIRKNENAAVDIEIYFEYDSDKISPQAVPGLIKLGKALSDPRLGGSTFIVAGHTDAKGSDDYNQQLSQKRALAVKRFLAENFNISESKLASVGYGEEQLKNPYDGAAAENRRVQIVNLTQN